MATQEWIQMVDDLDGSTEGVETVRFAVGDDSYEIELSETNREAFEEALAPYIEAGRLSVGNWVKRKSPARRAIEAQRREKKTKAQTKKARKARVEEVTLLLDPATIRAWAIEQGIEVSTRGRIPASVIDQYQKASA